MKRRLIALVIALTSLSGLKAGHEIGGVIITYKSVGHITGDSLDYLLRAYTVYSTQGVPSPSSATIDISSSCYSNSSYSLPKYSNSIFTLPGSDYCTGTNPAQYSELIVYQDTVTLQGVCQDFKFTNYINNY